jgi:quinolinate synthase
VSTTVLSTTGGARPFSDYAALTAETIRERTWAAKRALARRAVILGHHYQRESVIEFADFRGDSFKLSQLAAQQTDAEFIVFCGVHFMAESADILRAPHQTVVLPDLKAGCSMADMAVIEDVEEAWDRLTRAQPRTIIPVTYMNSTRRDQGVLWRPRRRGVHVVERSRVLEWAWARASRCVLLSRSASRPQHGVRDGRAARAHGRMGLSRPRSRCASTQRAAGTRAHHPVARLLLGAHQVHRAADARGARRRSRREGAGPSRVPVRVVQSADLVGSTEFIIEQVKQAADGASWAIGTEVNLVHRLALEHPGQHIRSLQKNVCPCATMNRIDPAHLLWALDNLAAGHVVNPIRVPEAVKRDARVLSIACWRCAAAGRSPAWRRTERGLRDRSADRARRLPTAWPARSRWSSRSTARRASRSRSDCR